MFGHIARMPPLRQTGKDNQDVPASRSSASSNRIWDTATLRSPKQQIMAQNRPLQRMMSTYQWRYTILELYARNNDDDALVRRHANKNAWQRGNSA